MLLKIIVRCLNKHVLIVCKTRYSVLPTFFNIYTYNLVIKWKQLVLTYQYLNVALQTIVLLLKIMSHVISTFKLKFCATSVVTIIQSENMQYK